MKKPRYKKTKKYLLKQIEKQLRNNLLTAFQPFVGALNGHATQLAIAATAFDEMRKAIIKQQTMRLAEILNMTPWGVEEWLALHPQLQFVDVWEFVLAKGTLPTQHETEAIKAVGVDLVLNVLSNPKNSFEFDSVRDRLSIATNFTPSIFADHDSVFTIPQIKLPPGKYPLDGRIIDAKTGETLNENT